MKQYETEMLIQKNVFYNNKELYGVFACNTVEYSKEFKFSKYGNISIKGNVPKLAVGNKYKMIIEGPYEHPKYGVYYSILELKLEEMNTVETQDSFLLGVISNSHFNALKKAYPQEKLVDFIMADKVDVQHTKGIKEPTLNKIKNKVAENLKLFGLLVKLNMLQISSNKLTKILQHFRTASKAIAVIDRNIYELCKISGFGFKTVDEIAMRRGDDPENKQRIEACILHYLHKDTQDGHTWSNKSFILAKCVEVLDLQVSIVETVMRNMGSDIFQNEIEIALARIRDMEIEIYRNLKRINDSYVAPFSTAHVEYQLKQTEKRQGFEFTDEQRTAIIKGYSQGVMVLNGLGGAGKTATVKGLIESLETKNYMTAALSGKAVNVLSQRGINASTIHRMLRLEPSTGGFYYNENEKLPYDVIVLDEVSMINVELILSVLKAIPSGSKLVLVGDSGQLPAIGYGDVLRDLLSTNMFAKFELTKVHRQAAKSGILSLANRIRKGEQVLSYDWSGKKVFGENEDQSIIGRHNKKEVFELVLETAKHYKAKHTSIRDLLDFQVIVANKDRGDLSVKNLNNALQGIFNDLGKPSLNRNGYNFREGDKIITQGNIYDKLKFASIKEYYQVMRMCSNLTDDESLELLKNYKFDLFNGTLGYIETISLETHEKLVFIHLDGEEGIVVLEENELNRIDMAYAATVHKLQGSSIKNVVLALDSSAYLLLSKQLVYTALTRASERGVALVETNAFRVAIKNDASGARRTYLADIILSQMQHK